MKKKEKNKKTDLEKFTKLSATELSEIKGGGFLLTSVYGQSIA